MWYFIAGTVEPEIMKIIAAVLTGVGWRVINWDRLPTSACLFPRCRAGRQHDPAPSTLCPSLNRQLRPFVSGGVRWSDTFPPHFPPPFPLRPPGPAPALPPRRREVRSRGGSALGQPAASCPANFASPRANSLAASRVPAPPAESSSCWLTVPLNLHALEHISWSEVVSRCGCDLCGWSFTRVHNRDQTQDSSVKEPTLTASFRDRSK